MRQPLIVCARNVLNLKFPMPLYDCFLNVLLLSRNTNHKQTPIGRLVMLDVT